MRTSIRKSTFETNSSSVHALVFVPDDVYAAWEEKGYLCLTGMLDYAGTHGAFVMDVPVTARLEDVFDENEYWERVRDTGEGWLEPEDVLERLESLPFANLSSTDMYVREQVHSCEHDDVRGGWMLTLDYDGWRG